MDKFRIVTNGDLALGFAAEEVRKNLAQLCKYDHETLDQLFNGFPFTFKAGLDDAAANRYKLALDKTGIVCRIEVDVPEVKIELDTDDSYAISHHPRSSQEQQMLCPKCGESQPKRMTCNACGVVVEKFIRQQHFSQHATPVEQPVPVEETASSSGLLSKPLTLLVALTLLGTIAFFAYKILFIES